MSPAGAHAKPPKRPPKDKAQPKPAVKNISHAEAVAARDAIWAASDALFVKGWK